MVYGELHGVGRGQRRARGPAAGDPGR
jgi:hypothetical protein